MSLHAPAYDNRSASDDSSATHPLPRWRDSARHNDGRIGLGADIAAAFRSTYAIEPDKMSGPIHGR